MGETTPEQDQRNAQILYALLSYPPLQTARIISMGQVVSPSVSIDGDPIGSISSYLTVEPGGDGLHATLKFERCI